MTDYTQLHAYLVSAVDDIRKRLGEANIGGFRLDIECAGRTLSGDANIEYTLGESYSSNNTRGGSLAAVIDEFLRRSAWEQRHAAKAIPAPGHATNSDNKMSF